MKNGFNTAKAARNDVYRAGITCPNLSIPHKTFALFNNLNVII